MMYNQISSRIAPILATIGGLIVAVFVGYLLGTGSWGDIYVPTLAVLGIASVLWLGSRYWLLIPFSLSFTAPVIPFGGRAVELPELIIVSCAVVFLARIALKTQRIHFWRRDHLPFFLYAGWAALIFLHHPIGFSVLGSSSGGARFYLKIFLALLAFLIVANQKITERDCKWILIVTVVGSTLDLAKTLFFYYLYGGSAIFEDPLEHYTWQQELAIVPLAIALILFARYRTAELFSFSKIWRPILLFICIPIILLSGKRSAAASLVLFPLIAVFFRKEYRYLALWAAGAFVAAVILIAGQDNLFQLPLNAQRSLSFLPARWDSSLDAMEGGKDIFRENLRKLARERIRQHPWIGLGYDVDSAAAQRLTLTMGNKSDASILQMALGSQWHNRWLGYAADFGIPAIIFAAIIYGFVIWRGWKTLPRLPRGSLLETMVLFILITTVVDIVFSNVGGHSATDAFNRWWMFGVLVAIARTVINQKSLSRDSIRRPSGRSGMLEPALTTPSIS